MRTGFVPTYTEARRYEGVTHVIYTAQKRWDYGWDLTVEGIGTATNLTDEEFAAWEADILRVCARIA